MKLLKHMKDGGPESRVHGFFLVEIKRVFSVVLLHFLDASREAYHTHAFHAISWVLSGKLVEDAIDGTVKEYRPSLIPIITRRSMFHKVTSVGGTWVLTFRGPWSDRWLEYLPTTRSYLTLTHGRNVVASNTGAA